MSNLTILRRYARKTDEELAKLPPSVLLTQTANTITIYDLYPKSNSFHFLLLPRITNTSLPENALSDLRSLLKCDKEKAQKVLETMAADAEVVKSMVQDEMRSRFDFEWPIFIGFHAIRNVIVILQLCRFFLIIFIHSFMFEASMIHLHMHIIASDLFSSTMKHKKHYNSFHPTRGFFLPSEDVLSWFTSTPSYYHSMKKLPASKYESLLKEDLVCWQCDKPFSTIPKLKEHLKQDWELAAKIKDGANPRNAE